MFRFYIFQLYHSLYICGLTLLKIHFLFTDPVGEGSRHNRADHCFLGISVENPCTKCSKHHVICVLSVKACCVVFDLTFCIL